MSDTAIKAENVSMMFNLSREHEVRIKEYVINLLKHKLFFDEFWALQDVSFEVKKGDSLGLVGTNGSGKTTMLKLVAGIMKPTKGKVTTEGSIAPLFAMGTGFDSSLSARENIFLVGSMRGYSKKYMQKHFDEIIDFAELENFVDVPLRNYSSGMSSRLAFAIATLVKTDILIADEVLAVGDAKFRKKSEDRMAKMMQDGVTILFVSHSSAQVRNVCKNAIWLDHGKLIKAGPSAEICKEYDEFCKK
ncbi:MAG: ABC transporter ATP-binding protein [Ruminococcaceae bacterium]|nr:ABC transporter ATP-binding protein [Oscillospiraceae bacterium]